MRFNHFGYSAVGLALLAGSAQAGGFSRGTADTDILFEQGNFNFRAGAYIAVPHQEYRSAPTRAPSPGLIGEDYLDTYVIPSAAVKFGFTDNFACAGTYTDSNGAASSYSAPYGVSGKLSEEFTVAEFGATCAAFFDVGRGRLALLGGAFLERFDYSLDARPTVPGLAPIPIQVPLNLGLDSSAYGWRAGIGYEIPEIAFRAQLLYRSGTSHDATGSADTPLLPGVALPAFGSGELPQSVELKVQSGIAPGWLAFGSVKWTDWSVNETLDLRFSVPGVGTLASLNEYYWRDGWTVTAGVGHAFNENVSGVLTVQWDRGVSTGYDLRNDKWLVLAATSLTDKWGGELRLGGGVSYLSSADITEGLEAGASVDSGWAGLFAASYSVKW
ncbi:outer membrane protein transport protein [Chelativorans sp. AA-79]|uniref:outer membrane protein transport protein n=1 Tax=Chelativorans sp. AA-79 TaxID=3028735 RepID=UPI0023F8DC48|nr:outer membrane protein transport protein [Chelativorans sp. AA-79]WEX07224.1 outer membrane protein transport protein [Chelativorans sp. AA-79]